MPRGARLGAASLGVAALGAGVFWLASAPDRLPPADLPPHHADLANGRVLFFAGSCLYCHRPADPRADRELPSGGAAFATPLGTFYPQNLTPDPQTGLGRWSAADFLNAMTRGVSPRGRHYFPAFPYASFRFMRTEDLLDLYAYLMSLRPVRSPERPATVPLLPLARRGVGLWKRLAFRQVPPAAQPTRSAAWQRGAYLVTAPGHCGECHTPRNLLMIPIASRALAGGAHPAGEGRVPGLRGLLARHRYRDAADLASALEFGETYGYDKISSGGMGQIQSNLARLPESDLQAIAEYLVSLQ
ncbi:MAG TPA: cytochrome c [Vicinamibacteria bacterium]|nr:cytochrome c [Vicinamibacteria bacterium]